MNHGEDFVEQLGRYLFRTGLTQQELANKTGLHRNTIGKWMNRTSLPEFRGPILRVADELILSKEERKAFIQAAGFLVDQWPTEVWTVPQQQDMFFTGRDEALQSLRQFLVPGSVTTSVQAITGLGGVGKTHTAIEYAYRFHQHYEAVLWLQADSWEALSSECLKLAPELGLPEQKEIDLVIAEVQRWLRKHRHWLLVLDNVENPQEILTKFVPTGHHGSVLVTTRIHDVEPLAQTQLLSTLSEQDGVLFLLRRTKKIATTAGLEQANAELYHETRQIWQLMDGLPLALDQAGAYVLETSCSFSAYVERYTRQRAILLRRRGNRFIGHEASVATTFSLAFERIEAIDSMAADILRVCSLLQSEAIPEEFFLEGAELLGSRLATEKDHWDLSIGVLQEFSLLQRNTAAKILAIHRLVQAILQDTMDKQTEQIWLERAIRAMSKAFLFGDMAVERWKQYERLLPHALLLLSKSGHLDHQLEEADILLNNTAIYLMNRAQYKEAELLYQRALQASRRRLGSEHPGVASRLNNLAALHAYQGRHEKAEPLFQQTLQIYERTLGPEHLEVAHSLSNLANLYRTIGRYKEAEPLFQQALPILERNLGTNHVEVATCLSNWAILTKSLGNYEEAESLYKRALQIQEQILGSQHPEVARNLDNLAVLYTDQGRYEEAKLLHEQALRLREQILGPEHPEVARSLNNLGSLYSMQAKYREAMRLCERALRVYEQTLAPEHPDAVQCINNLAALCAELGEYEKAEILFRQSLQTCEQTLGPDHPAMANYLENLAIFYTRQRRYEEAEPLYLRALQIGQQALGLEHPRLAEYMNNLAALYTDLGKYGEAEPLYQLALQINKQALGSEHPNIADNLNNLANLYVKQGKDTEAESFYQQARRICEQAPGPDHPHIAYVLSNLASLYAKQGKYEQAEPLYQRALHIREQAQEPQNLETAETMHNLAQLREAQGNSEEARDWYTRALTIRQQALGTRHSKTMETRARLINLLRTIGQHEEAVQLEMTQTEQGTKGEEQRTHPKA